MSIDTIRQTNSILQIVGPDTAGVVEVRVLVATVVLDQPTQTSVVDLITAGPIGPRGPEGPQGPVGPYAPTFDQTFATPSTTWVIVHNMGVNPVVTLFDLNNEEIEGDVTMPDKNTVVVNFEVPFAGWAHLKA